MGLHDSDTIILSYLGKSLRTNFSDKIPFIVTKNSLGTVYVSMALPGGSSLVEELEIAILGIRTASEDPKTTVLKQFLNLTGCLSLSEDEITTLAISLKEPQI